MALIFSKFKTDFGDFDLFKAVEEGKKIETRRMGKCRWKVGRTYAVKRKRTGSGVFRVRILEIRRERLSEIHEEGIRAEGLFPMDRNHFIKGFKAMHKKRMPKGEDLDEWNPEVWVLRFVVVRETTKSIQIQLDFTKVC